MALSETSEKGAMTDSKSVFSASQNGSSNNLLFAIPKKGRLNEKCMQLLAGAGLDHKRPDRVDVAVCNNIPVRDNVTTFREITHIPHRKESATQHVGRNDILGRPWHHAKEWFSLGECHATAFVSASCGL